MVTGTVTVERTYENTTNVSNIINSLTLNIIQLEDKVEARTADEAMRRYENMFNNLSTTGDGNSSCKDSIFDRTSMTKEELKQYYEDQRQNWKFVGEDGFAPDTITSSSSTVKGSFASSVVAVGNGASEASSGMKSAFILQYDFITSDESYSNNEGMYVIDILVGRYGREHPSYNPDANARSIMKKLSREYIIDKLTTYSHVHNNPWDEGLDMWGVQDGVNHASYVLWWAQYFMLCIQCVK